MELKLSVNMTKHKDQLSIQFTPVTSPLIRAAKISIYANQIISTDIIPHHDSILSLIPYPAWSCIPLLDPNFNALQRTNYSYLDKK